MEGAGAGGQCGAVSSEREEELDEAAPWWGPRGAWRSRAGPRHVRAREVAGTPVAR